MFLIKDFIFFELKSLKYNFKKQVQFNLLGCGKLDTLNLWHKSRNSQSTLSLILLGS